MGSCCHPGRYDTTLANSMCMPMKSAPFCSTHPQVQGLQRALEDVYVQRIGGEQLGHLQAKLEEVLLQNAKAVADAQAAAAAAAAAVKAVQQPQVQPGGAGKKAAGQRRPGAAKEQQQRSKPASDGSTAGKAHSQAESAGHKVHAPSHGEAEPSDESEEEDEEDKEAASPLAFKAFERALQALGMHRSQPSAAATAATAAAAAAAQQQQQAEALQQRLQEQLGVPPKTSATGAGDVEQQRKAAFKAALLDAAAAAPGADTSAPSSPAMHLYASNATRQLPASQGAKATSSLQIGSSGGSGAEAMVGNRQGSPLAQHQAVRGTPRSSGGARSAGGGVPVARRKRVGVSALKSRGLNSIHCIGDVCSSAMPTSIAKVLKHMC